MSRSDSSCARCCWAELLSLVGASADSPTTGRSPDNPMRRIRDAFAEYDGG